MGPKYSKTKDEIAEQRDELERISECVSKYIYANVYQYGLKNKGCMANISAVHKIVEQPEISNNKIHKLSNCINSEEGRSHLKVLKGLHSQEEYSISQNQEGIPRHVKQPLPCGH